MHHVVSSVFKQRQKLTVTYWRCQFCVGKMHIWGDNIYWRVCATGGGAPAALIMKVVNYTLSCPVRSGAGYWFGWNMCFRGSCGSNLDLRLKKNNVEKFYCSSWQKRCARGVYAHPTVLQQTHGALWQLLHTGQYTKCSWGDTLCHTSLQRSVALFISHPEEGDSVHPAGLGVSGQMFLRLC